MDDDNGLSDNDSSSNESFDENILHDIIVDQGDDQYELLIALIVAILSDDNDDNNDTPKIRGGSLPGKSRNINRNRGVFEALLNEDYFGEDPTYNHQHFRRRFRMSRPLYLQIENQLQSSYRFLHIGQMLPD